MAKRRGLVLGAGGVLGAAWTTGALVALQDVMGLDARDVDHLVGTSAGSVLASLLGNDVTVAELRDHQLGQRPITGPLAAVFVDPRERDQVGTPVWPRPGIGSARLLARSLRQPQRYPPTAVVASMLPPGRGSLASVAELVTGTMQPGQTWTRHANTWIVAMDYDSGRRVVFGRAGAPEISLPDAVRASCAIPGWYESVSVGGHRYVDGGTCSPTSLDLLGGLDLDEVYVFAPMISVDYDRPTSVAGRLERAYRRRLTRRVWHEAGKVRAHGTHVVVLGPGAEDLEAIGANLMDPGRREQVLATSLRTSSAALRRATTDQISWAG
jgi:NTE family protein